ncbi:acetoin utilization AcuB family protein [Bacillus sp. V3B]|uniref:acetoin utilization AcuB family protein n=1 Tax=Bacillus sp. V3B TaxID=2804915 RepID=UPI00210F1714|nr:acetoin utilization AcuB family protein [Bacillus sp. V3B]MCQ6274413.1 acetoin utilization AcuB family protein [Bacillus sp. V3B]
MIVEEIMKTKIITLSPEQSIYDAHKLMLQHKVRHLPVLNEESHLIGIVSDRDIRDAAPSILSNPTEQNHVLGNPVKTIMSTNLITGHPLDFVEEIGTVFYEHHISCLPIVQEHQLVGIITEIDLLHTLIELTGAHQPGSQMEIKAPNRAGVLNEITTVFRDHKANILSVLIYPNKKDNRFKIVVIRVQTINPTRLIIDLKQAGFETLWPNLPEINK